MRRRQTLLAGAALLIAVTGIVAAAASLGAGRDGAPSTTLPRATKTADVVRRDLVATESVSGTLGYGTATGIGAGGAGGGTVTAVPKLGAIVRQGETLFEIDGVGVPLLHGLRPMWRDLGEGIPDGPDVAQLETALRSLGFDPRKWMAIDEHFDQATTTAVKRWQANRQVEETGVVRLGQAVFHPADIRVATIKTPQGSAVPPGNPILEVTGLAQLVTVGLTPAKASGLQPGSRVEIELADRRRVPGTVAAISSSATSEPAANGQPAGETKVEITITLDSEAAGAVDQAPVTVRIVKSERRGVLAVPVTALLALAEGGYAVEVEEANGLRRLVGVETGLFASSMVEVAGPDIRQGMRVVVPA